MAVTTPFDLGKFAEEVTDLLERSSAIVENGENDKAVAAEAYRLALRFVDALGSFKNAHAFVSLVQTHLNRAVGYRYPIDSVDVSVELGVKDMLSDPLGRLFGGYVADDEDELEAQYRDRVSAGITEDNRQIAELLGEDQP